jgi:hypothetical protein
MAAAADGGLDHAVLLRKVGRTAGSHRDEHQVNEALRHEPAVADTGYRQVPVRVEPAEPDDVARYEKYLELLRETASTGREATAVIQRSLQGLRDS